MDKKDGVQMEAFIKDQVEAARVLRGETVDGHSRRYDACYLAMRYLDEFQQGTCPSVERVCEVAERFAAFLAKP